MAGPDTMEFTEDNFESEVLQADGPVLVDFWAEWCGPCVRLAPTIDQVASEYKGRAKVGKLDTEAHPGIAAQYGISSIPTVMIFSGGEVKEKIVGLRGKSEYVSALDRAAG